MLNKINGLEVFALMDNISDPFTTMHEDMRWNECQYRNDVLHRHDFRGSDFCLACNGLSLLIRLHTDTAIHTLLFDAGPDENLVVENAIRLQVKLADVSAIVLSHGHYDHYGGILSVLDEIGKQDLPVYTHPNLFDPLGFDRDHLVTCSHVLSRADVESHGGRVIETRVPELLFDDTVLVSGEVPRITSYELGSPDELRKRDGQWQSAPEVVDERILIFDIKDKGLCVFTACGHTGVINAVQHAKSLTGVDRVHCIMGGFHLAPAAVSDRIKPTISDLVAIDSDWLATGHCTGRYTQAALTQTFGDRHMPYGVGTVFRFGLN